MKTTVLTGYAGSSKSSNSPRVFLKTGFKCSSGCFGPGETTVFIAKPVSMSRRGVSNTRSQEIGRDMRAQDNINEFSGEKYP